MNILVIDDDKDFLYVFSKRISKEGHHVYTATNGLKALDSLEDHEIDLIISDVVMRDTPIMSLTCTLKHLYPKTPLILISGMPSEPMVNNSLSLGADGFLPKPIHLPDLLTTLNKHKPS